MPYPELNIYADAVSLSLYITHTHTHTIYRQLLIVLHSYASQLRQNKITNQNKLSVEKLICILETRKGFFKNAVYSYPDDLPRRIKQYMDLTINKTPHETSTRLFQLDNNL